MAAVPRAGVESRANARTICRSEPACKLRKGGVQIFAQIGNLAQQQQLESPAVNASDMNAALGKAEALQPLANRVAAFGKHIECRHAKKVLSRQGRQARPARPVSSRVDAVRFSRERVGSNQTVAASE